MFVKEVPIGDIDYVKIGCINISTLDFLQNIKKSFMNIQNWLSGIYTSFLNLPITLLGALWGISYLVQACGLDINHAANVISMLFVGMIFGAPFMGWFSNKIKSRRYAMLLGAITSGATILCIIYLHFSVNFAFLLFLMLGVFSSSQILGYTVVAESNKPTIAATSVSIVSLLVMSGGTFFQPLFGWLMLLRWDGKVINGIPLYSLSNYRYALILLPLAFVIAIIAVYFIKDSCNSDILKHD